MIEPEDLIFPYRATRPSNLAISESAMHSIASRLKGLESKPVIGGFDADHLQQIHARIFKDALPQAGKLRKPRPSSLSSSLDSLFDKLARENRLKGLELDEWSKRATEYLHGMERINPFDEGSEIASIEFLRELAIENSLTLHLEHTLTEFSGDEPSAQVQSIQRENLRRRLILAVDPDVSPRKWFPARGRQNSLDLFPLS